MGARRLASQGGLSNLTRLVYWVDSGHLLWVWFILVLKGRHVVAVGEQVWGLALQILQRVQTWASF